MASSRQHRRRRGPLPSRPTGHHRWRVTDRSAGGRVQSEAPHHGASTPEGAALDDPTVGAFAIAAGSVDAVSVVSVLLFYALEVGSSGPHVFGPLSDATTAVFDVLALPL